MKFIKTKKVESKSMLVASSAYVSKNLRSNSKLSETGLLQCDSKDQRLKYLKKKRRIKLFAKTRNLVIHISTSAIQSKKLRKNRDFARGSIACIGYIVALKRPTGHDSGKIITIRLLQALKAWQTLKIVVIIV